MHNESMSISRNNCLDQHLTIEGGMMWLNDVSSDLLIGDRWQILEQIGEGNFGVIFKVKSTNGAGGVGNKALKIQKVTDQFNLEKPPLLQKETEFLNDSKRFCDSCSSSIPKLFDVGCLAGTIPYMVIDLLGKSLDRVLKENGSLPVEHALHLGLKMLEALEQVHDLGWVHRDVKPSNFALPFSECLTSIGSVDRVFVMDFGRVRRFRNPKSRSWLAPRAYCHFGGPLFYASLSGHNKQEHGPHDDIQSILYCTVQFFRGTLPWLLPDPGNVFYLKCTTPIKLLYQDFPREMLELQKYIFTLRYGISPDYSYCRRLFLEAKREAKVNSS